MVTAELNIILNTWFQFKKRYRLDSEVWPLKPVILSEDKTSGSLFNLSCINPEQFYSSYKKFKYDALYVESTAFYLGACLNRKVIPYSIVISKFRKEACSFKLQPRNAGIPPGIQALLLETIKMFPEWECKKEILESLEVEPWPALPSFPELLFEIIESGKSWHRHLKEDALTPEWTDLWVSFLLKLEFKKFKLSELALVKSPEFRSQFVLVSQVLGKFNDFLPVYDGWWLNERMLDNTLGCEFYLLMKGKSAPFGLSKERQPALSLFRHPNEEIDLSMLKEYLSWFPEDIPAFLILQEQFKIELGDWLQTRSILRNEVDLNVLGNALTSKAPYYLNVVEIQDSEHIRFYSNWDLEYSIPEIILSIYFSNNNWKREFFDGLVADNCDFKDVDLDVIKTLLDQLGGPISLLARAKYDNQLLKNNDSLLLLLDFNKELTDDQFNVILNSKCPDLIAGYIRRSKNENKTSILIRHFVEGKILTRGHPFLDLLRKVYKGESTSSYAQWYLEKKSKNLSIEKE